jgi:nicotinamide riboside transporter PnuC
MLSQHPFTVVFMEGKYTTYTTYKYTVLFTQIYNLFQFQYHPHTHDTNNKKLWLTRKVNRKTIIMTSMGMSEMIQNCNIVVERLTNVYQCQNLSFHFPYCHLNHFVSWKSNKVYLSVSCVKKLVLWWHADNLCQN